MKISSCAVNCEHTMKECYVLAQLTAPQKKTDKTVLVVADYSLKKNCNRTQTHVVPRWRLQERVRYVLDLLAE